MEPVSLTSHSPILAKSQKRAVVLYGDYTMMVVKDFNDSGLVPKHPLPQN